LGPKQKVSLIFEFQDSDEEDNPFIVGKRFTKSLNEKASLRKFLEKWKGSKYTPAELQLDVDLETLIGLSATLFIVLNETDERTYAKIESVLPYKNQNVPLTPMASSHQESTPALFIERDTKSRRSMRSPRTDSMPKIASVSFLTIKLVQTDLQ